MKSRILLASLMAGNIVLVALAGTAGAVENIHVGTRIAPAACPTLFPSFSRSARRTKDAGLEPIRSDHILNDW